MTTIERPYWPHSNPEPPEALRASESGWVATPPQNCLNGCETGSGDARRAVVCQPGMLLCSEGKQNCLKRLDKWLRSIPDNFGRLLWVKDHGTVAADPGSMHVKRPDPPAPMRLEVVDLLDTRVGYRSDGTTDGRGVLGIVHRWAELVRDDRHDSRPCTCDHARPSHTHRCSAIGCGCQEYTPVAATVAREVAYLIVNLAWCASQEFAGDLYQEIRVLARTLDDTVGEYRPKPVGRCSAMTDETGVCGGPLVMDREGTGVHCLKCPNKVAADGGLRELGLIVDRMFRDHRTKEAS